MTSAYQFITPRLASGAAAPQHTLFVYEGPDWCLEEVRTEAGALLHCWSYELVEVEQDAAGSLRREIIPRGRDWIGSCLLRTLQVPCEILKVDEKGVWMRLGAWERLQWATGDKAAAEAWAAGRAVPAVAVAAAVPAAARGRGGGRGRGRGGGARPAAAADCVCRIRL